MIRAARCLSATVRWGASPAVSLWAMAGLLVLSELAYISLVRLDAVSTAASVLRFLATMAALFLLYGAAYLVLHNFRGRGRHAFLLIVGGALLFRMTMLLVGLGQHKTWQQTVSALRADIHGEAVTYDSFLLFDNDIWRYLWDGHVAVHHINPYSLAPRSPVLDTLASQADRSRLWRDIRANINYADVPTIYPPLAQGIFRCAHAVAPGSVFAMKLLLVGCDLVTLLLLSLALRTLHRPIAETVLYAWNPLVIKAVAGSGHVDAALAMLLAATVYFVLRRWRAAAAMAWGLAVLVKISPIVLLPFLARRIGWRRIALGLALVVVAYAPYLDSGGTAFVGLRTFTTEWQFNSGFFRFMEWLAGFGHWNPVIMAEIAAGLAFLMVFTFLLHVDDGHENRFALFSVTTLAALLLLSPTVMPWYLVWIVPLAVVARSFVWIQFSALVCVAFLVMIDGTERALILWAEFAITAVLGWREYLWSAPQGQKRGNSVHGVLVRRFEATAAMPVGEGEE